MATTPSAAAPKASPTPNRSGVVQPPAPRNDFEDAAAAIDKAEAARKAQEATGQASADALPQNILDEMEAGKAALARHNGATPKA